MESDCFEGVYAESGASQIVEDTTCWTINVKPDQTDAGGYSTWRIVANHTPAVVHISTKTVVTILFNDTVTGAEFEGFNASWNGSTVTLTRESHANAYNSGDNFNSLLKIWGPNFSSMQVISSTITCTHEVNVQGGYD